MKPKASGMNPYLTFAVPAVLVLVLIILWSAFFIFSSDEENEPAPEPSEPSVSAATEQPVLDSSRPQPPVDDQRKTVAKKAEVLLNEAREIGSRGSNEELFNAIAKGDESGLPKTFLDKFRIIDKLDQDKEIRAAAILSVLQLGQVLAESFPEDRKIELLASNAYEFVYMDLEAGNAHVPLSLFLGPDAAFSFEYVWVNGRWVFAPYSFVDSVSSANIAASGASQIVPQQ